MTARDMDLFLERLDTCLSEYKAQRLKVVLAAAAKAKAPAASAAVLSSATGAGAGAAAVGDAKSRGDHKHSVK